MLINYNKLSNDILQKLYPDSPVQSLKQIKLHSLPLPYITIDSIVIPDRIEVDYVKLAISVKSLLTLQPKVKCVHATNVRIYSDHNITSLMDHDKLVADLINYKFDNPKIIIDHLSIININNGSTLNIDNVVVSDSSINKNNTFLQGAIKDIGTIAAVIEKKDNDDTTNFQLEILNNKYKLQLSESYQKSALSTGHMQLTVTDLVNYTNYILPDLHTFLASAEQQEPVTISCDIKPTTESIELSNILINSTNAISGLGQAMLTKTSDIANTITLHFANVDFRSLFNTQTTKQIAHSTASNMPLLSNLTTHINITIDTLVMYNGDTMRNVQLIANLTQNNFELAQFTGIIASHENEGKFQITGNVTQNAVRSVFEGKVILQHGDLNDLLKLFNLANATTTDATPFTISADLRCTPIELSLQNMILQIRNTEITGNVISKFIGSTPRLKLLLHLSAINLDDMQYPVISPTISWAKNLVEDMQNPEYLNKFIPIRTLQYLGNFDVTFNNVTIAGKNIDNVHLAATAAPAEITLKNLYITIGKYYLKSSWQLQTDSLKPKLELQIYNGVLPIDFINTQSIVTFKEKLLSQFSLDKIDIKLNGFLTNLVYNDLLSIQDIVFSIENDSILLKIPQLKAKLFSGALEAEGSVLLKPYTWNMVYAFNGVNLLELSKTLPQNLQYNNGGLSINGMITSNGDTIETLLYNLYTKSSFVVKDLTINNFAIDDLATKLTNQEYNESQLDQYLKYNLPHGATVFNNISGDINIEKGIATLLDVKVQTKYSSGALSAAININNGNLQMSSIFSFYILSTTKSYNDRNKYALTNIKMHATGTVFNPVYTINSVALQKAPKQATTP